MCISERQSVLSIVWSWLGKICRNQGLWLTTTSCPHNNKSFNTNSTQKDIFSRKIGLCFSESSQVYSLSFLPAWVLSTSLSILGEYRMAIDMMSLIKNFRWEEIKYWDWKLFMKHLYIAAVDHSACTVLFFFFCASSFSGLDHFLHRSCWAASSRQIWGFWNTSEVLFSVWHFQ